MNAYDAAPVLGDVRVATDVSHYLAEGPTWDPIRGHLLWVDIMAGAVYAGTLDTGGRVTVEERVDVSDTAGAVAVSAAGDWVIAGSHRLHHRTPDGAMRAGDLLIGGPDRRLNDGKADPAGRFVVGTKGPTDAEQLLRVDRDGTVTVLDADLSLSNGIAWTRDGRTMFNVDTLNRTIYVRDYDPQTGTTGARRIFVEITAGYPDGLTIDADDHLWVAVWGEGCVLRISPAGDVVGRVDVPAPHTSCPTFAGPDLDILVITTATEGLSADQLLQHPLSGRLFTVRTGHRGSPPNLWGGVHTAASTEGTP